MRKTDVQTRDGSPAANVKVYGSVWSIALPQSLGSSAKIGEPMVEHFTHPEFTHAWIEEHVSDESVEAEFNDVCRYGFDTLQEFADEIWDGVTVYSAGRSGGWAIVTGLPDIDTWDAVMLAKWSKFEAFAKACAKDVPYQMLMNIYMNEFETWIDERETEQSQLGETVFI